MLNVDDEDVIVPRKKPTKPFSAVLNLVNSVLGAGVLGIPYAFAKAGIIPSVIIFVMMIILNYVSLLILCYISDATLVYSYGDVSFFPFFILLLFLI